MSIADETQDESKLTFKERAWNNFLRRNYDRTIWYYNQIKDASLGKDSKNKSDFDAAKQIMIGTIVGNYKNKLNSLKNVTPQVFSKMKQEFKKIYESLNLDL